MKDKNELPEKNLIREVNLGDTEITEMFPTADLNTVRTLEVIAFSERMAHVAIDFPEGPASVLHLYIHPEYINTEVIMRLREIYYASVIPWVNAQGKDMIVVQCHVDDTKTATLMRTFGFELTPVHLGVQFTGE